MLEDIAKRSIAYGPHFPHKPLLKYLEWSLLKKCLTTFQINCVLDVGANHGQFALNLRKIGYQGWIISFEPVEKDFALLTQHFQGDARWRGFNLALGNEDGSRQFNIAVESTEMSSFLDPLDSSWNLSTQTVKICKLDTLFPEIITQIPKPARIFLKMDTQGYDLEVVKGASQSITSIIGLQSELSVSPLYHQMPSYLEALAYYQQLGFSVYGLVEAARGRQGNLLEINCYMMRIGLP